MLTLATWTLIITTVTTSNVKHEDRYIGPGDINTCHEQYKYRVSLMDGTKLKRLSGTCCVNNKCVNA